MPEYVIEEVASGEPREFDVGYGPMLSYTVRCKTPEGGSEWLQINRKADSAEPEVGDVYSDSDRKTARVQPPPDNAPDDALPTLKDGSLKKKGGGGGQRSSTPRRSSAPSVGGTKSKDDYWTEKAEKDDLNVLGMRRAHAQEMALRYAELSGLKLHPDIAGADTSNFRAVIDWFERDTEGAVVRGPQLQAQTANANRKPSTSEATTAADQSDFESAPPPGDEDIPF